MKQQPKISPKQAVFLIITMILATVDVFLPSELAQIAGRDAWMSALGAALIGYFIYRIILALGLLFPESNQAEYTRIILGKYLGGLLVLAYTVGALVVSAAVVVQFSVIMGTAFKPESPPFIWHLTLLIPAVYVVSRGIEVPARMNEVLMPLGLALLLFVISLNFREMELGQFLPMLYEGVLPPIKGAIYLGGYMSYSLIIMVLVPLVEKKEKLASLGGVTFILTAVALLGGTAAIPIFGPELTAMTLLPALAMIRNIDIGFVTRLDAFMIAIWYTGLFIFLCLSTYIPAINIQTLFGFRSHRWLLLVNALIILILANIAIVSVPFLRFMFGVPLAVTLYIYSVVIPLFLYIIARLRGYPQRTQQNA